MTKGKGIGHRALLVAAMVREVGEDRADAYALYEALRDDVPSCAQVDQAQIRREVRTLVAKGVLEFADTVSARRGGTKNLYRYAPDGGSLVEREILNAIRTGGYASRLHDDDFSRFLDVCAVVDLRLGPKRVAEMIENRIKGLERTLSTELPVPDDDDGIFGWRSRGTRYQRAQLRAQIALLQELKAEVLPRQTP